MKCSNFSVEKRKKTQKWNTLNSVENLEEIYAEVKRVFPSFAFPFLLNQAGKKPSLENWKLQVTLSRFRPFNTCCCKVLRSCHFSPDFELEHFVQWKNKKDYCFSEPVPLNLKWSCREERGPFAWPPWPPVGQRSPTYPSAAPLLWVPALPRWDLELVAMNKASWNEWIMTWSVILLNVLGLCQC